jgi:hypothetical protein
VEERRAVQRDRRRFARLSVIRASTLPSAPTRKSPAPALATQSSPFETTTSVNRRRA